MALATFQSAVLVILDWIRERRGEPGSGPASGEDGASIRVSHGSQGACESSFSLTPLMLDLGRVSPPCSPS